MNREQIKKWRDDPYGATGKYGMTRADFKQLCDLALRGLEAGEPVAIGSVSQKVMARLADLLDEDQFKDIEAIVSAAGYAAPAAAPEAMEFQQAVGSWMLACFGDDISNDKKERNHRFLEESLELAQACGCTKSEAEQLVDYVFGRPVGERSQEVGGVMLTLAALCRSQSIDMKAAGETELARVWTKIDQIRAKQAAKPKHSPLPQVESPLAAPEAVSVPVEPTEQQCFDIGRGPAEAPPFRHGWMPDTADERKGFEAYMRGHCWDFGNYDLKTLSYDTVTVRMLYGIWRDRGYLAMLSAAPEVKP